MSKPPRLGDGFAAPSQSSVGKAENKSTIPKKAYDNASGWNPVLLRGKLRLKRRLTVPRSLLLLADEVIE
jgi:hypothetical protein